MTATQAGDFAAQLHELDFTRINPFDGSELPANQRAYRAKSGKIRIKANIELLQELDQDCEGFCVNCGATGQSAEPDAVQYVCDECGEAAVYGAGELIIRGLAF